MPKIIEASTADAILAHGVSPITSRLFTNNENRHYVDAILSALRGARRFYLDDEMTSIASELGQLHPELLLAQLSRARAPFERTLIDYSVPAFVGRNIKPDSPKRAAVVVEHVGGTRYRIDALAAWNDFYGASLLSLEHDLEAMLPPSPDLPLFERAFLDSLRQRGVGTVDSQGKTVSIDPETIDAPHMVRNCLVGSAFVTVGDEDKEAHELRRRQLHALMDHARWVFYPPTAAAWRRATQSNDAHVRQSVAAAIEEAITEHSGQWRLIIAVLTLLQQQDFVSSDQRWKGGTKSRVISGKIVPFLEHRLVSLRLPRRVITRRIIRRLAEAIPRRRHEVMGHWAHRHGVGRDDCKHAFVAMTEHRQVCAVCGFSRWWISDHGRGDSNIGYVTKDRIVEPR